MTATATRFDTDRALLAGLVAAREVLGQLADEQAALRRVATLVAQGVRPVEIFSAVSEEVGRLFGSDQAAVGRFESDSPAIVVVGVGKATEGISIGERWELADFFAAREVFRTGRSARTSWTSTGGPIAAGLRRLGLVSTVASPVIVEGRPWGAVAVSSKDEPLPLDTEERLEKFTELVATAIANAEARTELATSRARVVEAADETRRRVERDLHDGVQQRLVTLGLALRSAEAGLPHDLGEVRAELSEVGQGLKAAVEELREIARGIHPAILAEGGLAPALKTLARRSPIPVALDLGVEGRLPDRVEVAAYYIVSEMLTNTAKHAQASAVYVDVGRDNGVLHISVRDDGVGGADPARGSGLVGLIDRVEALGGSICARSRPGEGTHVTAELPLEPASGRNPGQLSSS